jgi:Zinc-binding dehydrogenase
VQLAKHFGAHVTAVCSSANVHLVRSLGANDVIDDTAQDFTDGGPVHDVIVDVLGKAGFPRSLRALKPGGRYLLVGFSGGFGGIARALVTGGLVHLCGRARFVTRYADTGHKIGNVAVLIQGRSGLVASTSRPSSIVLRRIVAGRTDAFRHYFFSGTTRSTRSVSSKVTSYATRCPFSVASVGVPATSQRPSVATSPAAWPIVRATRTPFR